MVEEGERTPKRARTAVQAAAERDGADAGNGSGGEVQGAEEPSQTRKELEPQKKGSTEPSDELEGAVGKRILESEPSLPAVATAAAEQLLKEAEQRPQGLRDWMYMTALECDYACTNRALAGPRRARVVHRRAVTTTLTASPTSQRSLVRPRD